MKKSVNGGEFHQSDHIIACSNPHAVLTSVYYVTY